jgi:hypothetical protein
MKSKDNQRFTEFPHQLSWSDHIIEKFVADINEKYNYTVKLQMNQTYVQPI